MRVLMVSKACIVGQYQTKLEALARHRDLELTVVVPPFWKDERVIPLERAHTHGYTLMVEPIALQGHFHLHFYPTLPRVLRRIAPDIVHVDEEPYNLATFLALRAARGIRARTLFFTWQNLTRRYPPPFSWLESSNYRRADYALAGTREAAEVLRAKGYRGALCVIPQFGIDPDEFSPVEPSSRMSTRIGFVGRLIEGKGAQVLLSALAGLKGDWQLVVMGQGPTKPQLQAQAAQLGIAGRVCFEEPRASTEMPAFFRQIDILVAPSLTRPNWKEQFGRVLVEAMSCQVPVVASNSGEIPNVVGDAGLLFPEGDVSALRSRLEFLLRDKDQRAELGRRGRARVLAHYTQVQIAEETYAVYRELCAPMAASRGATAA